MLRRTGAKTGEETDDRLARWQLSERTLADAAHAFAQLLSLSWRGSAARRLASYFETAEATPACEEEDSAASGASPNGESGYDREPDEGVPQAEESKEPPCGAEPRPPGDERVPDRDRPAEQPRAKELPLGAGSLPAGHDREPDENVLAEAKAAKEPPRAAESLSPGFDREPDKGVSGGPKTKEPLHVAEPSSQRHGMRDGFHAAKRSQRPVSGVNLRRAQGDQHVGECEAAPAVGETEGWFRDLAQRVGSMRRRSGPVFDSWSIHLPMDPEVLPDTELRIRASREWMALRFFTHSPVSVRLISEHTPVLQRSLETTLDMKGQIDIDLE